MARGKLRFGVPDESIPAEERAYFVTPQNKEYVLQELELNDFRTSKDVVHGPEGLDVQGFTWLEHHSEIAGSDTFFDDRNIEDIYLPEVKQLIKDITGARSVVVWNGVTRRKLPAFQDGNPTMQHKKGGQLDQIFDKLPRDVPLISGKTEDNSIEPVRNVHIDMNNTGLRDTARYCRHDIREAGREALEAEDRGDVDVPRYAAFSVWRPLETVVRDPMAACDWRSVDEATAFVDTKTRTPSDNEQGEFMNTIRVVLPPSEPVQQKWYFYPNQGPDTVLILKIGDTAADRDSSIASGTPHGSPMIIGTEDVKTPRCSIEVRVLAFW